jgi:hypothetical protein
VEGEVTLLLVLVLVVTKVEVLASLLFQPHAVDQEQLQLLLVAVVEMEDLLIMVNRAVPEVQVWGGISICVAVLVAQQWRHGQVLEQPQGLKEEVLHLVEEVGKVGI